MDWLKKHLGFAIHLGDFRFKRWLDKHASEVVADLGIRPRQVVLDFGCGTGTYTIPAAKLVGRNGKVYALDISKRALDKMEKKSRKEGLNNIVRIDASAEGKIPLEDNTIDHVLLINVLQEIDDKEGLINETYRILKTDGALSVYPMHIEQEEVIRLTINQGFILKNRKIDGRILIFGKTST